MKYQNTNKFRITSIFLTIFFLGLMSASITHAATENYKIVKSFGSYGSQFNNVITGVATDSSNNVYVSSESYAKFATNGSVSKYNSNCNLISWWIPTQRSNEGIAIGASNNIYLPGDGYAAGLTGYLDGNFYHIYSNSGSHIKAVSPNDFMKKLLGSIYGPGYITVDHSGNVYVSDFDADYPTTFKFNSFGDAVQQLRCAGPMVVDSKNNLYVAGGNEIKKFDSNGNVVKILNSTGYGPAQFSGITGIAIDSQDNIYVDCASSINSKRIQKLDTNGNFISQGEIPEECYSGSSAFSSSIAIDGSNNIYRINGTNVVKLSLGNSLDADFTSNVTNGTAPLTVKFTNTSTGSPTSWSWEFGEGNTSTEQNPIHTYYSPGNYTVTLTASNAESADSFSQEIKVTELTFDVNLSKIRTSDNVQFDASKSVDGTEKNVIWDFGDDGFDGTGNTIVTHKYIEPGSYVVKLMVEDSTGVTKTTSKIVNVTIPVVLVHGFRSDAARWQSMSNELQKNGFEVWNFDYKDSNTADPRIISLELAAFIEKKRHDLSYNGQEHTGKVDVICHSMGAIVSRLYMEVDEGGVHGKEVRQWIGIAPAHHGAALANHRTDSLATFTFARLFGGDAGWELQTFSPTVLSLGPISRTTKYRVLAGWNPTHDPEFGNGYLSATLAEKIDASGSTHYWTHSGDMIIATEQSYDPEMQFEAFPIGGKLGNSPANEFDHIHIINSPTVIQYVIECEKDINKQCSNEKPTEDIVPYDKLTSRQRLIDGRLNNVINRIFISVPELLPIGSNNGPNLRLGSSITQETVQETKVSSEEVLSVILDWDEGNIDMTLTSPSGVEYSKDSLPDGAWYEKEGNSLYFILTNPESGNWTTNLIPVEYPDHDISYNLTYIIKSDNDIDSENLPEANFTANVTSGAVPLDIQFNDTSSNSPTSWQWHFGDGSSNVSDANPEHLFTSTGLFPVVLTVSNGNGLDSKEMVINVTSIPIQPNTPVLPTATIGSNTTSGVAPLTVQFNDLSTNETSGRTWAFGDGTSSTDPNPIHTFTNASSYTVNLTASNGNGTNTTSKLITVTSSQPAVLKINDFTAKVTNGYVPLKAEFVSNVTGSNITKWRWVFEPSGKDTYSQHAVTAKHTFTKPGKYDITLTVWNAAGQTATLTKKAYITVLKVNPPKASFVGSPTSGKTPLTVKFTDKSTNTPTSWYWSFGDKTTSTTQNPVHKYKRKGTYKVSLAVKNAGGSSSVTKTKYIVVK